MRTPPTRRFLLARRQALLGAGALMLSKPAVAATDWVEARPEDVGLGRDLGNALDAALAGVNFDHLLRAIIVARHGRLVFEHYFPDPVSGFAQHPRATRSIASVTKSVTGLLYGIALARGAVPAPDAPLMDQFPEYADLASEEKKVFLVEHALTMTLGLRWNEELPYGRADNDANVMFLSQDPYRFVLAKPIVDPPGTKFVYNGGATELLGRLIAKGTGRSLEDFARANFFAPLDIDPGDWALGTNGQPMASSGIRISARDLARIGQLVLDNGIWNGRAVVPETWLRETFRQRVAISRFLSYGYQWRIDQRFWPGKRCLFASGNGSQRIFVFPAQGLVIATMGNAFNLETQGIAPRAIVGAVLASLRET